MRLRLLTLVAAGVVGLAAIAGVVLLTTGKPAQTAASSAVGGPFTMTDDEGRPFTQDDLKGRPTAMFFGFTHCPEVCPTTLMELADMMGTLGEAADRLNVVFVSVDPERDTPELLHDYVEAFDPRIIGLTGTAAQTEAMARAYRVYYQKVEVEGGYTMDHAAMVYLLDRDGQFSGLIGYGEDRETALAKLQGLIAEG